MWGSLHITMSLHAYSQNTNVETEATKTQKTHTITIKHADSILNRCNIFASNAFNELLEVTETGRQKNLQYFINKIFFTRPRSEHSPTFVNNRVTKGPKNESSMMSLLLHCQCFGFSLKKSKNNTTTK